LIGKLLEHVDFGEVSIAELHAFEHIYHPTGPFAAGGALAATFVLIEFGES
jgi:hypothetical protein